jgi:hypothetical protein
VFHGILKNDFKIINKKVFVFFREIENINNKATEKPKIGSKFIEIDKDNHIDKEISDLRAKLKSRVEMKIGSENTKTFTVNSFN